MSRLALALTAVLSAAASPAAACAPVSTPLACGPEPYPAVVDRVARLVSDPEAQRLAGQHGLSLMNVLWEDTGRWQGSAPTSATSPSR